MDNNLQFQTSTLSTVTPQAAVASLSRSCISLAMDSRSERMSPSFLVPRTFLWRLKLINKKYIIFNASIPHFDMNAHIEYLVLSIFLCNHYQIQFDVNILKFGAKVWILIVQHKGGKLPKCIWCKYSIKAEGTYSNTVKAILNAKKVWNPEKQAIKQEAWQKYDYW